MVEIELMFGRNIGGKAGVTEEQWTELVAGEITPRFPMGSAWTTRSAKF